MNAGAEASSGDEGLRVVLCNAPPDAAERLARMLVERRLAACVNVLPQIVSFYRWEGALTRDAESTLLIKTRASRVPALTEALVAEHPYDVPEVIALPIAPGEGNPAYLAWVLAETKGAGAAG